jgi:hypothetical protein
MRVMAIEVGVVKFIAKSPSPYSLMLYRRPVVSFYQTPGPKFTWTDTAFYTLICNSCFVHFKIGGRPVLCDVFALQLAE